MATKKQPKKKVSKHYRSAESGRMVNKFFAAANPKTTVSEKIVSRAKRQAATANMFATFGAELMLMLISSKKKVNKSPTVLCIKYAILTDELYIPKKTKK